MQWACAIYGPVRLYNIGPQYLINGRNFFFGEGEVIEHKMCVLTLSIILPETFLIVRRNEGDMIKNVYWSLCEVPFIVIFD
jgi:hypothetical protein